MIVDTGAYVWSLIQVLLCCVFRDFLIPLLVWKNHLRNRSYRYRFWFCVITQASLQINLVLLLGFFNICNRWTIIGGNTIVYLLIAWNFSDKRFFQNCKAFGNSLWHAYKEEWLVNYIIRALTDGIRKFCKSVRSLPIWTFIRKNWLEVFLLGTIVVYNIWFLTYNLMRYHCYQFSDIPVHQSWIYNLEHGTLFSDGIYPFGMHAMVYFIRVIFQLDLREILLYSGAYQTVLLMIGLYLLAKEIFYAKYTPITVVAIVSLMLNQSRYAASLPQEAGMYAAVGVAYFMIKYLHEDRKKFVLTADSFLRRMFRINSYINKRYIRSESILFILCVAAVIEYHFYAAIAAIFMVVAIGLAYILKIFRKQYFVPLVFCGIMGAIIAVLPFGASLAKGIPFQNSMKWATNVIAGKAGEDAGTQPDTATESDGGNGGNTPAGGEAGEKTAEEEAAAGEKTGESNEAEADNADEKKIKVNYGAMTFREILQYYYDAIFNFGAVAMFGSDATQLMFYCMALGLICAFLMSLSKKHRIHGQDYMALLIIMLMFSTVGAAKQLGIVELIEVGRVPSFSQPFVGFIYMLPVDFAFRVMGYWKNRYYRAVMNVLSAAVCAGAVFLIITLGWYHSYFGVIHAYYNEPAYLLRHIKQSYDRYSYTVVSPTDEYYELMDFGYHTQIAEFMNMVNGKQKAFTFPTKYVFFFIEKHVLNDFYYGYTDVDLKYAAMEFRFYADEKIYDYERAIIESQAYYWAKKFEQIYPQTFRVFYEDDIYIAYILEQNVYHPYDLQVDYLEDYAEEIEANGWSRTYRAK